MGFIHLSQSHSCTQLWRDTYTHTNSNAHTYICPPTLTNTLTHTHTLTHSRTHPLTHSRTQPWMHTYTHSPTLTHTLTNTYTHLCTHALTHLLVFNYFYLHTHTCCPHTNIRSNSPIVGLSFSGTHTCTHSCSSAFLLLSIFITPKCIFSTTMGCFILIKNHQRPILTSIVEKNLISF